MGGGAGVRVALGAGVASRVLWWRVLWWRALRGVLLLAVALAAVRVLRPGGVD